MTDPTGRSFLSYRRSRSEECARLIASQRERGIPTWRDVDLSLLWLAHPPSFTTCQESSGWLMFQVADEFVCHQ